MFAVRLNTNKHRVDQDLFSLENGAKLYHLNAMCEHQRKEYFVHCEAFYIALECL